MLSPFTIFVRFPKDFNRKMKRIHTIWMLVLLLAACKPGGEKKADTPGDKPVITVSIEPLRYFTEAIAGDRFDVVSMVPKGSSPETYDPTPAQLMSLSQSTAYLRIGFIGFEQTWMDRLTDNAPHLQIFDTSHGIDLIFPDGLPEEEPHAAEDGHAHHGPEPHIWNSPANARIIATNVFKALCTLDTKHRDDYLARYDSLCTVIDRTDSLCRQMLAQPGADHAFMIYHPALSYLARDYGLLQLSIEDGGKEPSPAHLKELINACREENIHVIFVQPEFDRRNAELIARQTGTRVVDINPLAYDWEAEMLKTVKELIMDN